MSNIHNRLCISEQTYLLIQIIYIFLFYFLYTPGTKVVVNLCIKYNVSRLIYTSTSAVTLMPYMGRATFSLIVNQTESKAKTPTNDNGFLIPGYPSSKLRAEKIVLGAYGATLANGVGTYIFSTRIKLIDLWVYAVLYNSIVFWIHLIFFENCFDIPNNLERFAWIFQIVSVTKF